MNKITGLVLCLLTIVLTSFKSDKAELTFKEKLEKSKIAFEMPEGYKETPTIANKQMLYDYAMKNVEQNIEVRVALRPLDDWIKTYKENSKKEGVISVDPNNSYPASFMAICMNISGGKQPRGRVFPKDTVKKEFNADWGATTFIEVGKEFGQDYKYCMLVAIHKDDASDVYCFYLTDDKAKFNMLLLPALHCLKFN